MKLRAVAMLSGMVALVLLQSADAEAGPTAPPFYVVQEQAPSGAAAPLNTPISVTLVADPNGPADANLDPRLTLTKVGHDVALGLKANGGPPTLIWVPSSPLEAETSYEARFNPGYEGVPDTIWTFTTGQLSTPPLSLEGDLAVTFEPGTDTVWSCPPGATSSRDGAAACSNQLVQVTKARVKIPRALGGFPHRVGTLALTDDLPYDFSPASKTGPAPYRGANVSVSEYADLDDPKVTEILITVPEGEREYLPCFAFAAFDARGDQATSAPLCVDEPIAETDEPDVTEERPSPSASGSRTSRGCTFGAEGSSNGGWLVALGLAVLARRRGWRAS